MPARPLVWIYCLSSHPCCSCFFSQSDSLLSHYTTRFHRRHPLNLDSLHFVPKISLFPSSVIFPFQFPERTLPPAWHGPLGSVTRQCCHGGPSLHCPFWVLPNASLPFCSCHRLSAQKDERFLPSLSPACSHPGQGWSGVMSSSPTCPHHLHRSLRVLWEMSLAMTSKFHIHISVDHPLHCLEMQLLWLIYHPKAPSWRPWGCVKI